LDEKPVAQKNILNANYQEIGVAVAEGEIDGKNTIIAVQMFGSTPGFVPISQNDPNNFSVENKSVVLGNEAGAFLPTEKRTVLDKEISGNNLSHEEILTSGLVPVIDIPFWEQIKEKMTSENRPDWMTSLALNTLWLILCGNLLFLAYSFRSKIKAAETKLEKNTDEQKISVENMEGAEEEVSVVVKTNKLHTAK